MPAPRVDTLNDIMLELFRVNGRLLDMGDRLVGPLGLTSARWQVMAAIAQADEPITAPQIAATLGISRQGAQKQLNRLVEEGLLEQMANPRHERSPLYALSRRGLRAHDKAAALEKSWLGKLAGSISREDLAVTLKTLGALNQRLEGSVSEKGDLR